MLCFHLLIVAQTCTPPLPPKNLKNKIVPTLWLSGPPQALKTLPWVVFLKVRAKYQEDIWVSQHQRRPSRRLKLLHLRDVLKEPLTFKLIWNQINWSHHGFLPAANYLHSSSPALPPPAINKNKTKSMFKRPETLQIPGGGVGIFVCVCVSV